MKRNQVLRLTCAGLLCALAVVGSLISFPVFGSKCAPVQHMVNVICALLLGPAWGVGVAFLASLLRNLLGLGSLLAFPGSMCGALLCGLIYSRTKKLLPTLIGEVFGTSVIGGLLAGGLIYIIASGKDGFEATGSMAANGYGAHSPDGYGLAAVLIAEIVLTAFFLWIILGVTDKRATPGAAGAVIGLALTLIHLISIPISNTSVNPARSMGVAFFHGDGAPGQLWVFWLAPIIGAIIAGVTYKFITDARD